MATIVKGSPGDNEMAWELAANRSERDRMAEELANLRHTLITLQAQQTLFHHLIDRNGRCIAGGLLQPVAVHRRHCPRGFFSLLELRHVLMLRVPTALFLT